MAEEKAVRSDSISLVYEGGITDQGEIHLYEYGRALYAFSRLVAVIEYYRRSGRVTQRITKDANVSVIVSAPKQGSFWVDALILVSGQVIPALKDVPFDVFFSFIMDVVLPKREERDDRILELAKIRLAEEKEKTKQTVQETERFKIFSEAISQQNLTTRQALETINWAVRSPNTAVGRAEFSQTEFKELEADFSARQIREAKIEKHRSALETVSADDLQKLTSRTRPLVAETGLPLRKSAKKMSFTGDGDKKRSLIHFDEDEIRELNEKSIKGKRVRLLAKIKSYDRESGWGKVRLSQDASIIPFVVPLSERSNLVPKIALALTDQEKKITANTVMNRSNQITSLILVDME